MGSLLRFLPAALPRAILPFPCLFGLSFHLVSLLLQRTQEDLQQLQSELRVVSERCYSFLDKAPAGPSTPHLRSELDLVVNKMEQTHGLSSIYLEK